MGEINTESLGKGAYMDFGNIKISIADMIYILDIQNKNPNVDKVLAKYGLDRSSLSKVKAALEKGRWKVQV